MLSVPAMCCNRYTIWIADEVASEAFCAVLVPMAILCEFAHGLLFVWVTRWGWGSDWWELNVNIKAINLKVVLAVCW